MVQPRATTIRGLVPAGMEESNYGSVNRSKVSLPLRLSTFIKNIANLIPINSELFDLLRRKFIQISVVYKEQS